MPSLDEVIKAIEVCRDYYVAGKIIKSDALHYLKEYKDKSHWLDIQISDHVRAFEQWGIEMARLKENPPLTWDELMTMVGKPVWVEVLRDNGRHYKWEGQWMLVKEFTQGMYGKYCHMEPNYRTWINTTYGDLWQAYRKEKK